MNVPRVARYAVLLVCLGGLVLQADRARDRLAAGSVHRQVELRSLVYVQRGQAPKAGLVANAQLLAAAELNDPANVGLVVAHGSQYLLMGRPDQAIRHYERALELEPRPETYLNLGRAYLMLGRKGRARRYFEQALALNPQLAPEVPSSVPRSSTAAPANPTPPAM